MSDDGDLEDDVGILQAEVRAAEAKIDELKMETQNAEKSVQVLLQQQKEQDEKVIEEGDRKEGGGKGKERRGRGGGEK